MPPGLPCEQKGPWAAVGGAQSGPHGLRAGLWGLRPAEELGGVRTGGRGGCAGAEVQRGRPLSDEGLSRHVDECACARGMSW